MKNQIVEKLSLLNLHNDERERIWFIDFEGYIAKHQFYVKEISLLNYSTEKCITLYIKTKSRTLDSVDYKSYRFLYKRHRLKWSFGLEEWSYAKDYIHSAVGSDIVYVKGSNKEEFLSGWFPHVCDLINAPSFKEMNKCLDRCCNLRHSIWCAKRKVYEMMTWFRENQ